MKKITYLLFLLLIVTSCQREDETFEALIKKSDNKDKVDICHKGRTINVHIDSIEDHLSHGDKLGPCSDDPNVNYTFVPDNNFEQALIDFGYDDVLDNLVLTSNISSVTYLDVRSKNIIDLTGIEGFLSLTNLNCSGNSLEVLDLSNNLQLQVLNCYSSKIEFLNVASNVELTFLNCNNNLLSELNLINNTNLKSIFCNSNRFISLNFSSNPFLEVVTCRRNRALETLNVQNGNNTNISAFDARFTPNLTCIQVDDVGYSTANWPKKDATASYSENCGF